MPPVCLPAAAFYAPAIIPLFIVFSITSIESIGDTTATIEASREATSGDEYGMRIKGALFNDGERVDLHR